MDDVTTTTPGNVEDLKVKDAMSDKGSATGVKLTSEGFWIASTIPPSGTFG